MIQRLLQMKFFLGSTTEQIELDVQFWLGQNQVCPGNLVDSKLYKHGSVYQFVVWHAVVMEPPDPTKGR